MRSFVFTFFFLLIWLDPPTEATTPTKEKPHRTRLPQLRLDVSDDVPKLKAPPAPSKKPGLPKLPGLRKLDISTDHAPSGGVPSLLMPSPKAMDFDIPYITLNHFYPTREANFRTNPPPNTHRYFDTAERRMNSWGRFLGHVLGRDKNDVDQPVPHLQPDQCLRIHEAIDKALSDKASGKASSEAVEGIVCSQIGGGAHGIAFLCEDEEMGKIVIKQSKRSGRANQMLTNDLMGALATKGIRGVVQARGWCSGASNRIPWNGDTFSEFESQAREFGNDINSFRRAFGSTPQEHARMYRNPEFKVSSRSHDIDFLVLSYSGKSFSHLELGQNCPAVEITGKILRILMELAKVGVTYTDMKPGNVCTEKDEITLIDLGGFVPEIYYYASEAGGKPGRKRVEETESYNGMWDDSSPAIKTTRALGITIANICNLRGSRSWHYDKNGEKDSFSMSDLMEHYEPSETKSHEGIYLNVIKCLWGDPDIGSEYQDSLTTYTDALACIRSVAGRGSALRGGGGGKPSSASSSRGDLIAAASVYE